MLGRADQASAVSLSTSQRLVFEIGGHSTMRTLSPTLNWFCASCARYFFDRRTLFFSTAVSALRQLYPENEKLQRLSDETRIVVSEPLGELVGAWHEVPESSYGVVQKGADVLGDFHPRLP